MSNQRLCSNCNAPLDANAKFCGACGTKLTTLAAAAPVKSPPVAPPATPDTQAAGGPPSWLTIWGTVAVLVILVVGISIYLLVGHFSNRGDGAGTPTAQAPTETPANELTGAAAEASTRAIVDNITNPDNPHMIRLDDIPGYTDPHEELLNVSGAGEHPDYHTDDMPEATYDDTPTEPVSADDRLVQAFEMEINGQRDEARAIYQELADAGNTQAMVRMGFLMMSTPWAEGNADPATEAAAWFIKAGDTGDTAGMVAIATLYQSGLGVPQDSAKAIAWYRRAADAGDVFAMATLGSAYFNGEGVPQDYAQAIKWLNAAGTDHAESQNLLGLCYVNGFGVAQDSDKAFACFLRAAELGWPAAMTNTGRAYYNGLSGPVDYAEAFAWFTKGANIGDASAQGMLGMMYYLGQGTSVNYEEAFRWTQLAANAGNIMAMGNLGVLYRNGQGTNVDYATAMEWYYAAAALGNTNAMLELGQMFGQGEGVAIDQRQAIMWYQQAARAGEPRAQEFLRSNGIDW